MNSENKRRLIACSVGLIVMCLAGMGAILWFKDSIPDTLATLATAVVGGAMKMLADAFSFEFGSSRSSQAKDATIAAMKKE